MWHTYTQFKISVPQKLSAPNYKRVETREVALFLFFEYRVDKNRCHDDRGGLKQKSFHIFIYLLTDWHTQPLITRSLPNIVNIYKFVYQKRDIVIQSLDRFNMAWDHLHHSYETLTVYATQWKLSRGINKPFFSQYFFYGYAEPFVGIVMVCSK